MNTNSQEFMHLEYLNALLSGNLNECSNIVKMKLQNGIPIKSLYEDVIKKALYEIGELWEFNKISITTEHMATSITESVLNEVFEKIISENRVEKNAIVACVETELHQVGIKMVADILEMNGWGTRFLGANMTVGRLISEAKEIHAELFALSLSIYFNVPVLERMIKEIRLDFPQTPIVVGGQAFRHGGEDIVTKYSNVFYLSNLNDIENFIHHLNEGMIHG
jgi:methanogenic corrinoid protein MtbC1